MTVDLFELGGVELERVHCINKTLHQDRKNKANKTRNATDVSNYKKQKNYVVKLNNQCKTDHFDRLNPDKDSKPF